MADLEQLRQRIGRLEPLALALQPDAEGRRELSSAAVQFGERYIGGMEHGPVTDFSAPGSGNAFSYDEAGMPPGEALTQLERDIVNQGVNTASPRFFGFIPAGGLYASALGDYLGALTNRYAGNQYVSPGLTECERSLVAWFAQNAGYPSGARGDLTSGGSIANLSAIVAAREAAALRARDIERATVYISAIAHHSLTKALRIAGLGDCQVRDIPLDDDYRMDVAALRRTIKQDREDGLKPWLIVATGGTTDLGTIDPLDEIADVAAEQDVWYHVDAAYGGAFVLCEEGRRRLRGIERSDSLIVDPHKGLFLPYGSGLVMVADGERLFNAFRDTAPYMQDIQAAQNPGEYSASDLSPELSRPFRGLRLWLALKLHGVAAFRAALEEKLLLAEYFYNRMAELGGYDLGPYPQLSVAAFRYVPKQGDANAFNRRLCDELREDGRIFMSSTTIKEHYVLRFAVLSYHTHLDLVDEAIDVIDAKVKQLSKE